MSWNLGDIDPEPVAETAGEGAPQDAAPPGFPAYAAKVLPWLEEALDEGGNTHTVADIVRGLQAGKTQLWIGERCFAVTEFIPYPQKMAFNIFLAGGERGRAASEFREIQHGMEAFARAGGATMFMNGGKVTEKLAPRIPWARIGRGWKPSWIIMTKELAP